MQKKSDTIKKSFIGLAAHPWHNKLFLKLSSKEVAHCLKFVDDNADCDNFDQAVQRMFLDCPDKPKHWKEIMELLTCAYSDAIKSLQKYEIH